MRARKGSAGRRAKKKLFRAVRGFYAGRSKLRRTAKEVVRRARVYATAHRKQRQRNFRKLWILRINAATRQRGLTYSRFMAGLAKAGVEIDRKMLSDLAIDDPAAFDQILEKARQALGGVN